MRKLLAVALSAACCSAWASSVDQLKSFIQQTQSARVKFSQLVLDKNHKKQQQSSGTMQFQRPGKFRWEYQQPYQQLIVGDGVKLWVYDKDLNQVSVRKLDQALGSSPAALLAGSNEIETSFKLVALAGGEGLEWLEAIPKSADSSFEKVRMGFNQSVLETMELHDHFGQITVIRFSGLERNPKLSPEVFKFVPPPGADVVGD